MEKKTHSGSGRVQAENGRFQLESFFIESLKDMYWAEKHLVKSLDRLQKNATTDELKIAFGQHKTVTEGHVTRIEQAFEMLGQKPVARKCDAIAGITREAEVVVGETNADTYTRDAALIITAQKAEHYEIASYGSLVQLAKTLHHDDIASLLARTLEEEKEADATLTQIAETNINEAALQE